MDVWTIALYVFASFLALRSLLSLMSGYEVRYKEQRLVEELENVHARISDRADTPAEPGEPADFAAARRAA